MNDNCYVVSINENKPDPSKPYQYAYDWVKVSVTIKELSHLITQRVWSPCVWDGKRSNENYRQAHVVAFDFDGNWELEKAKRWVLLYEMKHIIGVTKSHGILKKGQTFSDRFRLLLFANHPITSLYQYTKNMASFTKRLGSDRSCKDGGRFFFPCRDIVSFSEDGKSLSWQEFAEEEKPCFIAQNYEPGKKYPMPEWVKKGLTYGTDEGRNNLLFRIAATLGKRGWSEHDILRAAMCGPLGQLGESDVRRTIANGYKKGFRL